MKFSNSLLQHQHKISLPDGFVSLLPTKTPPVLSKGEEYCWVFHPSYGFFFIEGTDSYHFRFFKGDGKGNSRTEVIPNKLYDDCNRGYAFIDRDKKIVQIQTARMVKDYLNFVPQEVVNGFKQAFPHYEVFVKGSHIASRKVALDAMLEMINDQEYATHQHHSDPDFTTQNGKMYEKGTETEQGALNAAIPGSLLASKCAACESGDCLYHTAVGVQQVKVVPGIYEPTVADATFFKEGEEESDDFEITRLASGRFVIADTKSYGAGTPLGGTPNTSPNPNATPAVTQMTPEQRAQNAEQAIQPSTQQPPAQTLQSQPATQQSATTSQPATPPTPTDPLTQLRMMTTGSSSVSIRVASKESSLIDSATIIASCAKAMKNAGYTLSPSIKKRATQSVEFIVRHKTGSVVDSSDVVARINATVSPTYFVQNAAIPIKESPQSLPPRDDMRRHLDEETKDEVMEGVHEPLTTPAPTPTNQPTQSPVQPMQQPMSNQQMLLNTALASKEASDVSLCPSCKGSNIEESEGTNECLDCGCFFAA
jgi:hypothetical protein